MYADPNRKSDKKVEELTVGDLWPTVFGGEVPIKSITRNRFGAPVLIARSALGSDVRNDDLCVTRPHGLLIDGALIVAGNLFNSTTITWLTARDIEEPIVCNPEEALHCFWEPTQNSSLLAIALPATKAKTMSFMSIIRVCSSPTDDST